MRIAALFFLIACSGACAQDAASDDLLRRFGNVVFDPAVPERVVVGDSVEDVAAASRCEIERLPGDVHWLHRPRKVDAHFRGLTLGDALCALAGQTKQAVLVSADVARIPVQLELTQATWSEVVRAAAASTGAAVHQLGDVTVITSGALPGPAARWERLRRPPFALEGEPGEPRVSLDVAGAHCYEALDQLAQQSGRRIAIDPSADLPRDLPITLRLAQVPWRTATLVVARLIGLLPVLVPDGAVVLVEPTVFQARRADVPAACLLLARCDERTLALGSSLRGELTAELRGVTHARALELSAALLGHAVIEVPGGGWRIGRPRTEPPAEEPLEAALASTGQAARARNAAGLERALEALAGLPARRAGQAVSALVAGGSARGALLGGLPLRVGEEAGETRRLESVEPGRATLSGPGEPVALGLSTAAGAATPIAIDAEEPGPTAAAPPPVESLVPAERRAARVDLRQEELEGDLPRMVERISLAVGWPAVAPEVVETVSVGIRELPWVETLEIMARMCRCRLRASPAGALSLEPCPPADGVALLDQPLDRAALALGQARRRRAVVAPGAATRVGLAGADDGDQAAGALAAAAGFEALEGPGWLLLAPRIDEPLRALLLGDATPVVEGGPIDLDLAGGATGKQASEALAAALGRPIALDPALDQVRVKLRLQAVPRAAALEHLAALLGGEPRELAGALTIVRPPRVTLHLRQAPLRPVLEALIRRAGLEGALPCDLAPEVEGEVSLVLQGVLPREAVGLVAAAAGLQVLRAGARFRITGQAGLAEPAPPPADPRLDPLLSDLEEAARAGSRGALEAAGEALRARVRGQPTAAEQERQNALALDLAMLIQACIGLAEAREVDELVELFSEVRRTIESHPDGPGLLRQLLDGPDAERLRDLGEVRLSFLLQSWVSQGNALLRAMAAAIEEERPGDVPGLFGKLDPLLADMRKQEREVFHRNAAALEVRAESLAKQAKRLAAVLPRVPALRGTIVWSHGEGAGGSEGVAFLGGAALEAGATAGAAELVEVRTGVVRLRVGEGDVVRMVR